MHARTAAIGLALILGSLTLGGQSRPGLSPEDLFALTSVGQVELSPTGTHVAYSVVHNTEKGRPYAVVMVLNLGTGVAHALPRGSSSPLWAPDGRRLAYLGTVPEGSGLMVSEADGSGARLVAPVEDTNHPLPSAGRSVAWAPDGRRIAFVSATPGPESADAVGDPMVITRYLYKPTAGEGLTRFNDNRRTPLFVADIGTGQVTQLTTGAAYEHSIDWAPKGDDVPIAEAEQLYTALHDVGVPTTFVRYPREGHGLRETGHVVDALTRSLAWYRQYFGIQ